MAFKPIVYAAVTNALELARVLCDPYFSLAAHIQKRISSRLLYVFISLISISSFAYGNNYYVQSNSSCEFNGDGTSQDCAFSDGASGAWKGFSTITWGDETNQLGSGDTLHICGNHNESLEIGASGQPNSELIITGLCTDAPGTINGGYSIAAISTMANKHLYITNLTLKGGEVSALNITSEPKYAPVFVRVTNNTIHDPIFSDISGFGFCVKAIGSDILFSNNEIYNCSEDGIYIGGDRVEVAYSYIHDVDISNVRRGDCVKYTSIGSSSDGHVHHNLLDHSSNNIKKNSLIIGSPGSGIIVEYNTIIGGRVTINIRNHSNAIVRYNKIIPKAPETSVWSTGIALENVSNTLIYHNIIDTSDAPTFGLFSFGNSHSEIDNNVFVGDSILSNIRLVHDTTTYLRRNILDGERTLSVGTNAMLIESDFNKFIYDYPQSILYNGIAYNSLNDYQLYNPSLDQNSTSEDSVFDGWTNNDFELDIGTPLIKAIMPIDSHGEPLTGFNLDSSAENGNGSFFVELLEGSLSPTIGVILMPDQCNTTNGSVVQELRTSLNNAGYTTLSIVNPMTLAPRLCAFQDYVNEVDTIMPEVYARIRTAINYMETLGVKNIVLAGFGLGSRFTAAHIARGQIDELPIVAYVGIGMHATSIDPLNHSLTLDEISVPVLDLYGNNDTDAINTDSLRKNSYTGGPGKTYTQINLKCASSLASNECHKLVGLKGNDTAELEANTLSWLMCYAPLDAAGCTDEQINNISKSPDSSDSDEDNITNTSNSNSNGSSNLITLLVIGLLLLFRKINTTTY